MGVQVRDQRCEGRQGRREGLTDIHDSSVNCVTVSSALSAHPPAGGDGRPREGVVRVTVPL